MSATPCQPCPLHRPAAATGCGSWDGARFDLVAIVSAERPADCPFFDRVLTPLAAAMARRAHGLLDQDDLQSELIARILERFGENPRGAPVEPRHLRQLARQVRVDVLRRETGRRRCTACQHYQKAPRAGGTCQRQYGIGGQPHPHHGRALDARAEPHRLDPACHGFLGAAVVSLDHGEGDAVAAAAGSVSRRGADDPAAAVAEALAQLIAEQPLAGELVARNKLDGFTYEELARQHRLSIDQVKRLIKKGTDRLKELLGGSDDA